LPIKSIRFYTNSVFKIVIDIEIWLDKLMPQNYK